MSRRLLYISLSFPCGRLANNRIWHAMCQASVSGRTLPRFQKPSTFILELNNGREAAIFPPEAVLEKTGLSHQIVILLAEDEPLVRNVIRTILASSGYLVLDAADGIQAVELA